MGKSKIKGQCSLDTFLTVLESHFMTFCTFFTFFSRNTEVLISMFMLGAVFLVIDRIF